MPRVKPVINDNELKNLPDVVEFNTTTDDIQVGVNAIIRNNILEGLTLDQLTSILRSSKRERNFNMRKIARDSRQFTEEQLNEIPEFSSAEIKARKELSVKALEKYGAGQYIRLYKDIFIKNAMLDGKITEADQKELHSTRDIMQLLLKSGLDEKTEKENLELVNYLLGKNLDQSTMTPEEFKDRKDRRLAEAANAKMKEIIEFDYSRFHNMNDQDLVENWLEYNEPLTDIFVIRQEMKELCKRNKYIDNELVNKCNEIEDEETEPFSIDGFRIMAMATPYYDTTPIEFFDNVHSSALDAIDEAANEAEDGIFLKRFLGQITSRDSHTSAYFMHQVCAELNTRTSGVDEHNIQFFNAEGSKIRSLDDIIYAAKTTGVLAVPKDRPDLVTAYKYDAKARLPKVVELTPFLGILDTVTRDMPDLAAVWDAEDRMVRGTELEKFFEKPGDFSHNVQVFRDVVANAPHSEEMKAAMISKLQRTLASSHPTTDAEEFAKIAGLSKLETLSRKTSEERRQLTSRAVEKYTEYALADREFIQADEKAMAAADPAMIKDMVMKRVAECEAFCNDFYGRKISDADVVENMDRFLEFGNGMGKGLQEGVLDKCAKWGVTFTADELKRMRGISEKAGVLGDHASNRLNYILTAHYQFGNYEKFMDFARYNDVMANADNVELKRSVSAAFETRTAELTTFGLQLSKIADPSGSRVRDIAYDSEGNIIPGNDLAKIAEDALKTGRAMIFYEGEPNPVVVNIKDVDRIPPEMEKAEITPELRNEIRAARLNKSMSDIEMNGTFSPAMKELEESIVGKEYEISVIADSLKADAGNKAVLKNTMAEYLARLTVREMYKNLAAAGDDGRTVVADKDIREFADKLVNDPITDKVMEDIQKNPDGFNNMKSDEVYRSLLLHKQEANRQMNEKAEAERAVRHAKAAESARTIGANMKYFREMPVGNDNKFYGLTQEIKAEIHKKTPIKGFHISRAAVQAVAAAILINEGKDIRKLFDPELQNDRERAAVQAGKLFVDNNVKELGTQLGSAMKKLRNEVNTKLNSMKDMSVAEFTKPENAYLLKISSIFKDFTQEFDTAYGNMPAGKDKEKLGEFRTIQDQIEYPNRLIKSVAAPYSYFGMHEDRLLGPGKPDPYLTYQIVQDYVASKMSIMAMDQWKTKPENAGKPLSEFFDADAVVTSSYLNLALNGNKNLEKIMDRCTKDRIFANKVFGAILDDTFDKEVGLELESKADGTFKLNFDMDKAVKNLENRLNINILDVTRKFDEAQQRQNEPGAEQNVPNPV